MKLSIFWMFTQSIIQLQSPLNICWIMEDQQELKIPFYFSGSNLISFFLSLFSLTDIIIDISFRMVTIQDTYLVFFVMLILINRKIYDISIYSRKIRNLVYRSLDWILLQQIQWFWLKNYITKQKFVWHIICLFFAGKRFPQDWPIWSWNWNCCQLTYYNR